MEWGVIFADDVMTSQYPKGKNSLYNSISKTTISKNKEDLNKHFCKEDIQILSRQVKTDKQHC